jgi:hypothetical protein
MYFLARPRRFGKSLLVTNLADAFAGHRELFAGLYLETHWDWEKCYPVLQLDFRRWHPEHDRPARCHPSEGLSQDFWRDAPHHRRAT